MSPTASSRYYKIQEREEEMDRNFMDLLRARWAEGKFVCVGLDSEFDKIPATVSSRFRRAKEMLPLFNYDVVEATKDLV